jgi:hypothetical protein
MSDVTRLLSALEQGDPHAASRLLPLVYEEVRSLAAQRMAQEQTGQTLRPTVLGVRCRPFDPLCRSRAFSGELYPRKPRHPVHFLGKRPTPVPSPEGQRCVRW